MYSHRHGIDLTAYASEEKVYESAAGIVEDWTDENEDEEGQKEIVAMLVAKDYKGALEAWQSIQYEGSMSPETVDIQLLDVQ